MDNNQDGNQPFSVTLTAYEIANLRSLIEACGYASGRTRNPLWVANTGDWIGQVYNKLPAVEHPPNATAAQLENRAINFTTGGGY